MSSPPEFRRVSAGILLAKWRSGKYWERTRNNEFRMRVVKDAHPSSTKAGEPFCTRSQIVSYTDKENTPIAMVHQYLREDGTIGASGKPDPKRLEENGVVYYV